MSLVAGSASVLDHIDFGLASSVLDPLKVLQEETDTWSDFWFKIEPFIYVGFYASIFLIFFGWLIPPLLVLLITWIPFIIPVAFLYYAYAKDWI